MTESDSVLFVSWLLAAKCFRVPVTPASFRPLTWAAAIFPVRYGSSEKYSKFLPFRGFRWIFIPGPRILSILLLTISRPVNEYIFCTSAGSKVHASIVPLGRLNAFIPQSIRIPEGPSAQQPQGIPIAARCFDTPP